MRRRHPSQTVDDAFNSCAVSKITLISKPRSINSGWMDFEYLFLPALFFCVHRGYFHLICCDNAAQSTTINSSRNKPKTKRPAFLGQTGPGPLFPSIHAFFVPCQHGFLIPTIDIMLCSCCLTHHCVP